MVKLETLRYFVRVSAGKMNIITNTRTVLVSLDCQSAFTKSNMVCYKHNFLLHYINIL